MFIILSVTGVIISIFDSLKTQNSSSALGITLITITVLTGAMLGLLTKKFSKHNYSANDITYVMICIGFIVFTSIALVTNPISEVIAPIKNGKFIICTLYLGIGASVIGYGLYTFMYTQISAASASVFINLTTVVSTLVGVIILKESLNILQVIGSILIVVSVICANIIEYRKTN
ncbi:MAG: DMT family transporter [Bacilli bacterium]